MENNNGAPGISAQTINSPQGAAQQTPSPINCPVYGCKEKIASNEVYAHLINSHRDIPRIEINQNKPKVIDFNPFNLELCKKTVLCVLEYGGRNGGLLCTPTATGLCAPNVFPAGKNKRLVNYLPILVFAYHGNFRGETPKSIGVCRDKKFDYYYLWLGSADTNRPLITCLTVSGRCAEPKTTTQFHVFHLRKTYPFKGTSIVTTPKTDDIDDQFKCMRLNLDELLKIANGKERPLKLKIELKDYADPQMGLVGPNWNPNWMPLIDGLGYPNFSSYSR